MANLRASADGLPQILAFHDPHIPVLEIPSDLIASVDLGRDCCADIEKAEGLLGWKALLNSEKRPDCSVERDQETEDRAGSIKTDFFSMPGKAK